MDASVVIRRAVPDDDASVARIYLDAWRVAYRGLIPDDLLDGAWTQRRAQSWHEALGAGGGVGGGGPGPSPVFLGFRAGEPLGFVALSAPSRDYDEDGTAAKIMALNVKADAWRTGVGSALMDTSLRALAGGGWQAVSVWVVQRSEQARGFYRHFGFAADGATDVTDAGEVPIIRLRRAL